MSNSYGKVTREDPKRYVAIGWLNMMFDGRIGAVVEPMVFKDFFGISLKPLNDDTVRDGFDIHLNHPFEDGIVEIGYMGTMVRRKNEEGETYFYGEIYLGATVMCCQIHKSDCNKHPWIIYMDCNAEPILKESHFNDTEMHKSLKQYLVKLAAEIVKDEENKK